MIFPESFPSQILASFSSEYKKTEGMTSSDFLSNYGGLSGPRLFSTMFGIVVVNWIFKIVKTAGQN